MYAKYNSNVTFFQVENAKHTEKMFVGKVSEAFKTDRKDEQGRDVYEYENWDARFVGKAMEKAKALNDKDRITLTEWSARHHFDKEKGRAYTYIMVMDFEVRQKNTNI